MSLHNRKFVADSQATEVTPGTRDGRRNGLIGRLLSGLALWAAARRDRKARRPRRSGRAPPIPANLREDVGLPPLPPKLPDWWDRYYD